MIRVSFLMWGLLMGCARSPTMLTPMAATRTLQVDWDPQSTTMLTVVLQYRGMPSVRALFTLDGEPFGRTAENGGDLTVEQSIIGPLAGAHQLMFRLMMRSPSGENSWRALPVG